MSNRKRLFYCLIAGLVLGVCIALYNRCTGTAKVVKVEHDTIVVYDTIPSYHPAPKDSVITKFVTRLLPVIRTDTVTNYEYFTEHDTVAVAVPITSKHYQSPEYDAWVSGYEASLDSIKVYSKETVITETITRMKPPNRLSLDIEAGADYMTQAKDMATYAIGDLTYKIKDSRFSIGLRGGVVKMPTDKAEPFVGGVVKLKIF